VENVKSKVSNTATRAKQAVVGATDRAAEATPGQGQVSQTTRRVAGIARENPLGLAIGAAAIGFLAGLATPSTRIEDERLGPVADQVKDRVRETGQEALDRGRQVAQEVASTATDTARQHTHEHSQDLADTAKQHTQEAGSQARSQTITRS
jgi:hypothetical protein